ncbi:hypothetical protein AAC387_Pa05g2217 [Persea americana]
MAVFSAHQPCPGGRGQQRKQEGGMGQTLASSADTGIVVGDWGRRPLEIRAAEERRNFEITGSVGLGIPDMGFVFENISSNSLANASANCFGVPATCPAAADFACLNGNMMNTSKQQLLSIQNPTNSFNNDVEVNDVDCFESVEGFKEDLIGSEIDELEEGRDLRET